MRASPISCILLLVGSFASTRPAWAAPPPPTRGLEYEWLVVGLMVGGIALLAAAADVGFAIYDIVKARRGQRISPELAMAEVMIAAPQLVIGGLLLADPKGLVLWPDKAVIAAVLLLPAALAVHGGWSFATSMRL
jgi:hypothetical protein